jgi:hypothetical protein
MKKFLKFFNFPVTHSSALKMESRKNEITQNGKMENFLYSLHFLLYLLNYGDRDKSLSLFSLNYLDLIIVNHFYLFFSILAVMVSE